MKILAIGDFHGKFPGKLKKRLKKEKIDLILSPGDYCGNERLAKLYFKYVYAKDEDEIPNKIRKELKKLDKISTRGGIKVLKDLRGMKKLIYAVCGNWDPRGYEFDIGAEKEDYGKSDFKKFIYEFKSNLIKFDFKYKKFGNFSLIGGGSSSYPGKADKETFKRIRKALEKEDAERKIKQIKKHYAKRRKVYVKNFSKALKSKQPIIFLTHNSPYMTKMDKIKQGPNKGKHFGSYLERVIIKKYKPNLVIFGHMHEYQGIQKFGKSLLVNPGEARRGRAAIIDFNQETGKVKKVKFLR